MKNIFLFFCILVLIIPAKAQPPGYTGFGNTHLYTEQDGIDEENFYVSEIMSDGRVFVYSYIGSLFIIGNNYCKKIKIPAAAPKPLHLGNVIEISKNRFIAPSNTVTFIIENDSITKWVLNPEPEIGVFKKGDTIVGFMKNNLYLWKNDSFSLSYSGVLKNDCSNYFYADTMLNLWEIRRHENISDFYKIKDFSIAKLEFSINDPDFACEDSIEIKYPENLFLYSFTRGLYNLSRVFRSTQFNFLTRYYLSESDNYHSVMIDRYDTFQGKYHILHDAVIMNNNSHDSVTQSFYFGSYKKPFRYFQYFKKYPRIFNNSNASSINALTQDSLGRIWSGSYDGGLSIIDKNSIYYSFNSQLKYLPGTFSTPDYVFLSSEERKNRLIRFDIKGNKTSIQTPNIFIYNVAVSKNKQYAYLGTGVYMGFFIADLKSLGSTNPQWKIIDSVKGFTLRNIESITEDKRGWLWLGNPLSGFSIYYPDKDLAKTWLKSKNETRVGFWSSYTDYNGTVWLGTDRNGLLYYNDYSTDTIKPEKIERIVHPLLPAGTTIMQLKQWDKWLIIATEKDMLLMDLNEWYKTKKVLIRYLNPHEGNLTARTQQNNILIDKRDSSVWFATADMLYQWDIKKWLSLPIYKVQPHAVLHTSAGDISLTTGTVIKIKPTENTLKFSIWFQSRDNMPRYMSVALIKKGDSLTLPSPSLQTQFQYSNLAPGNYELAIQICQSDGSVSIDRFPILIKKFWWQYWWVWMIGCISLFIPFALWLNSRRKTQLAEEKTKRKEAELETIKAEQQKRLSAMQVVSLSNQFRPHFILNALNTIGAELDNKPQAESVLSRLGESIDLIFKHAQQQKITHMLTDEWRLVKNIIDIHQLMYLKKLATILPSDETINHLSTIQVPLGLLQIPVENALLHGLSNRETGPWQLVIEIYESETEVRITITDNGVGRTKAETLSNYRKHGTGTKNLNGILDIVNVANNDKITINYQDGIFSDGSEAYGTKAIITIPKNFQYAT